VFSVLWKNRQYAANRLRYAGGALSIKETGLGAGIGGRQETVHSYRTTKEVAKFEATFQPFCATFPDAFFVSKRGRVYLDPETERKDGRRRGDC